MKTIIISLAIAAMCFSTQAGNKSLKYVFTTSDTLVCKNLKHGFLKTKCSLHTGEKNVIPNKEISRIYKNEIKNYKCDYFQNSDGQMKILVSFYKNNEWVNSIYCNNVSEMYTYIDLYNKNNNFLIKQ